VGLPWPQAAAIALELSRALAWAHSLVDEEGKPLGLVHRDVKPGNVMIRRDGRVKLVDFGIAGLFDCDVDGPGEVRGTLGYMSPELIAGGPLDGRVDQFALGVLLYQMLIGHELFHEHPAPDERGLVPSPSALVDNLPLELDEIVLRMTHPDPEERFVSCAAVARALMTVLTGTQMAPSKLAPLAA
jgi:serine/threonine protein kinase